MANHRNNKDRERDDIFDRQDQAFVQRKFFRDVFRCRTRINNTDTDDVDDIAQGEDEAGNHDRDQLAGIDLVEVRYRASAQAFQDVISGIAQVVISSVAASAPFSEQLRWLAITSKGRFADTNRPIGHVSLGSAYLY